MHKFWKSWFALLFIEIRYIFPFIYVSSYIFRPVISSELQQQYTGSTQSIYVFTAQQQPGSSNCIYTNEKYVLIEMLEYDVICYVRIHNEMVHSKKLDIIYDSWTYNP